MTQKKLKSKALRYSSFSALREVLAQIDEPAPRGKEAVTIGTAIHAEYARKLECDELVAHMTNWERKKFAEAGGPGRAEHNPETIRQFLALVKETRRQK